MRKGFTLIELLLVIALLGISIGVTTDILLSLVRSYGKTQVINDIEQNANFVSAKLEEELRSANNATLVSPTELSLSQDTQTITYRVLNNELQRRVDLGSYQNLTKNVDPGGVSVTCPSECFSVSGTAPVIVTYDMQFSQPTTITNSAFSGKIDVKSTVVIRNSY